MPKASLSSEVVEALARLPHAVRSRRPGSGMCSSKFPLRHVGTVLIHEKLGATVDVELVRFRTRAVS
jgi:hypothetical protein